MISTSIKVVIFCEYLNSAQNTDITVDNYKDNQILIWAIKVSMSRVDPGMFFYATAKFGVAVKATERPPVDITQKSYTSRFINEDSLVFVPQ